MGVKGFITSTAIQRCDEREAERLVSAVGGIYPFLDPKRKERSEVNDKTGIYGFPWPAVTPSAPDKFVAGFQSTNDNSGKKDLRIIPCTTNQAESGKKKERSGENSEGNTECKANLYLNLFWVQIYALN